MTIEELREILDSTDQAIIQLLEQRLLIARAIGTYKSSPHKVVPLEQSRRDQMYSRKLGQYGSDVYDVLHRYSIKEQ